MTISTKNLTTKGEAPSGTNKRQKILSLIKHHAEIFEKESVENPKFIPRLAYKHEGVLIIGFYSKEIYGGKDIYVEFCDKNYIPEDVNRTLYKWEYNADYDTIYKKSSPHPSTGDRRYLIPVNELVNVTKLYQEQVPTIEPIQKEIQVENNLESTSIKTKNLITLDTPVAGSDVPFDAMTLRDYAAIHWEKPVSHKLWLNELITKNFK